MGGALWEAGDVPDGHADHRRDVRQTDGTRPEVIRWRAQDERRGGVQDVVPYEARAVLKARPAAEPDTCVENRMNEVRHAHQKTTGKRRRSTGRYAILTSVALLA